MLNPSKKIFGRIAGLGKEPMCKFESFCVFGGLQFVAHLIFALFKLQFIIVGLSYAAARKI
jgi:hypothetical protein